MGNVLDLALAREKRRRIQKTMFSEYVSPGRRVWNELKPAEQMAALCNIVFIVEQEVGKGKPLPELCWVEYEVNFDLLPPIVKSRWESLVDPSDQSALQFQVNVAKAMGRAWMFSAPVL